MCISLFLTNRLAGQFCRGLCADHPFDPTEPGARATDNALWSRCRFCELDDSSLLSVD